ncbi:hypothetical protein [Paenibacillus illinoisensis]|uniref:hypothetical protein n=1 Tax=Paenibacillus illinoisensis TaxID=59845 RepID=UPI00301CC7FC
MNTVQIKIVAPFKAKDKKVFSPGEKYTARRITLGVLDITTPFQIVDGTQSGYEIPFKNAIVLKEEKTYTQKQYDEILAQRDEALEMKDAVIESLGKHGKTITALQGEKESLLRTIERAIADNQIVPLPRDVVDALEFFRRNGDDWDTVIRFMVAPMLNNEVNVLRKYAAENGWLLISGMVNGYVVSEEGEGLRTEISKVVLEWWDDKQVEATESQLESLSDRVYNMLSERQTAVQ